MASPIFAMLSQVAAPAVAAGARTLTAAARSIPSLKDVRYTATGKIARGSRALYNKLNNERYGKPIGKTGMTWSQLADKGYGGGYTPGDAGSAPEPDEDE